MLDTDQPGCSISSISNGIVWTASAEARVVRCGLRAQALARRKRGP